MYVYLCGMEATETNNTNLNGMKTANILMQLAACISPNIVFRILSSANGDEIYKHFCVHFFGDECNCGIRCMCFNRANWMTVNRLPMPLNRHTGQNIQIEHGTELDDAPVHHSRIIYSDGKFVQHIHEHISTYTHIHGACYFIYQLCELIVSTDKIFLVLR